MKPARHYPDAMTRHLAEHNRRAAEVIAAARPRPPSGGFVRDDTTDPPTYTPAGPRGKWLANGLPR